MNITLYHYLFSGFLFFVIGLIGALISKQVIKILISIECMITGININFITFACFGNKMCPDGYIFALFSTAISAAEIAIALFIFRLMYIKKHSENISDYGVL